VPFQLKRSSAVLSRGQHHENDCSRSTEQLGRNVRIAVIAPSSRMADDERDSPKGLSCPASDSQTTSTSSLFRVGEFVLIESFLALSCASQALLGQFARLNRP